MHDPVAQTITLEPITPPAPLVLCNSGFLTTLAQVERDVASLAVSTPEQAQIAANLLTRLTDAGRKLESARAELKAPFLAKGREIDEAARAPAARIEKAKAIIKTRVSSYEVEQQRVAREAEEARNLELRRLEERRIEEVRLAREKTAELARLARETEILAMDLDIEESVLTPPKTEIEKQIDAVRFAAPIIAPRPSGIAFKVTLRIAEVDVAKLPEPFVIREADMVKLRAVYCVGWRDGQPIPEVPGVRFSIDRQPVATGRSEF